MTQKAVNQTCYAVCFSPSQTVQIKRKEMRMSFVLYLYSQLFKSSPRLQGQRRRHWNFVRLTSRNLWPANRRSPENWKAMKGRTKQCKVFTAKNRKQKKEVLLRLPEYTKHILVNQGSVFLTVLKNTTPNLTFLRNMKNVVHCA